MHEAIRYNFDVCMCIICVFGKRLHAYNLDASKHVTFLHIFAMYVINNMQSLGVVGTVRLANGLVPKQGIVEICLNGLWSRVCGVNWGYQESLVVCRQLGYPTTKPSMHV